MSRARALTTRQPNSTAELIFIYTCVWDAKTTHVCSVCECVNVLQYNIIVFIYLYMKPINMYATQRRVSPGARLCVSSGGGCVRDAGRAAEQAKAPASTSLPTTTRVSIRTNCNENPTSIFMQAGTGKSVRACEVYICVSVYLPPHPDRPSFFHRQRVKRLPRSSYCVCVFSCTRKNCPSSARERARYVCARYTRRAQQTQLASVLCPLY